MYRWYQNIFHVIVVLIVYHAANKKKQMKIILKQDSKSRKEYQNANQPGSSSNICRCCRSVVAPLLHRYRSFCHSVVSPMSHRYCTAIAPLSLHCCSAVTPVSLRYRSSVALLPLFWRFCRSVAAAVSTLSLLLSLLLSLTVVASRGRIRVTVFIGDCQARVSSSSEGCSTSQKTVKLESY